MIIIYTCMFRCGDLHRVLQLWQLWKCKTEWVCYITNRMLAWLHACLWTWLHSGFWWFLCSTDINRVPFPACLSFTIDYFELQWISSSCFKYYFLLIYIETSSEDNPLAIAITRLLALEQAIERRYLKHPLRNEWVTVTFFHPVIRKTFVTARQIGRYWTRTSWEWSLVWRNIIKKR